MILSRPQNDILHYEFTRPLNLFLAGVGSGKSHLAGLISYNYINQYPEIKGFVGANTHGQLNTSTLHTIMKVWEYLGVKQSEHYVIDKMPPPTFKKIHTFKDYKGIISFTNGAVGFIGSLDNAKAHDGKEFGWAILDETKDTKEEDVKETILTRLRQTMLINNKELNPLYIMTSPAKVKWLNEMFELENWKSEINSKIYSHNNYFSKRTDKRNITISSTYHNTVNLPDDYIENMLSFNSEERGKALIYANPFFSVGGEYFSSFSQLEHISNCTYNPELPLHISFDQNVVPYTPCLVMQIEEDNSIYDVNVIEEIALEHPRNTTEHLCREVLRRYATHSAGTFIYGDATGQRRTGMTANTKNHYDVIRAVLRPMLSNNSDRVLKSNDANIKRRDFINTIMENRLSVRLNVDRNCKLLIDDFTYLLQDVNGGKKIEKDKNGAEKLGHLSDCLEYFMCSAFRNIYHQLEKYL